LSKEAADQPVVQLQNFVRQRRSRFDHEGNQGAMPPILLILLELIDRALGTFACELQKPVLMNALADLWR
jgi:hypothetical protein